GTPPVPDSPRPPTRTRRRSRGEPLLRRRALGQAEDVEDPARAVVVRASFGQSNTAVRHDRTAPVRRATGAERGEQLAGRRRVDVQRPVVDVEQSPGNNRARAALPAVPGEVKPATTEYVAVKAGIRRDEQALPRDRRRGEDVGAAGRRNCLQLAASRAEPAAQARETE